MPLSTFILLFLFFLSQIHSNNSDEAWNDPLLESLATTTYRISSLLRKPNRTVVKEWESLKRTVHPFKSKDEEIVDERPHPADYLQNQDVSVCHQNTYLVLLYPSRVLDASIRNLIRRNVPQGIVISGKKVNRVFVVAVRYSDRRNMLFIQKEKEKYGDILISPHEDSKSRIAKSVWDGFLWVRHHCKHAVFAAKADPDEVIFLGNLINYLGRVPTTRFYGGNYREFVMKARKKGDRFRYFPMDYPYVTWVSYVSGALIILSLDVIDHLIVGAQYEPFFGSWTDDFMVGAVLNRVRIYPHRNYLLNCTLLQLNTEQTLSYSDFKRVSNLVVVYHGMKKASQLAAALRAFGNRMFVATGCWFVCYSQ